MKNEITGDTKQIQEGFNWGVFLIGPIYLLVIGDLGSALSLFLFDGAIGTMTTVAKEDYALGFLLFAVLIAHLWTANNYHKTMISILAKKDYKEMPVAEN